MEILEAAARSMADGGRPIEITSSFALPALLPWAQGAVGPAVRPG